MRKPQDGDKVLVSERPRGRFTRIRIPVAEASKPRRIEVTNGHAESAPQALDASSSAA